MTASLGAALAGEPVRVGTLNGAKCEAVRRALARLVQNPEVPDVVSASGDRALETLSILPVEVESGVPDQPIGYPEIVAGARQRARRAFESGACCLAVGIEDGLIRIPDGLGPLGGGDGGEGTGEGVYNVGCAWMTDGTRESAGFSSGFAYPAACADPAVSDREPIGDLFDSLWRSKRDDSDRGPSGPRAGNIGKLTGGRLPRSEYGEAAVFSALVRFLHEDLYD